ncbi:ribonuclease P subunit p30 [Haloferax mucosum ATCC BAA-1512]|uniref:Ribonuclease P protein component 3 n=1 Tax=Haloferax mucosum ATCC BAA-1512 TaxID=662479 RepID=M0I3Z8_9EURY|nr:RNase P subunit p30 family protein [Haloferax mucosum]ELZ91476.1 ribonuclease P subunit p30 [Haloferax mucosum ATCC BAA-1512]
MYEAVYAHPDGESTASRVATAAGRYGYDGIVVRGLDASPDYDRLRDELDVDFVDAVEIDAPDPERASGAVGNYRPQRELLILRGGTNALNRFAVEQPRIDVLSRPMHGHGNFNHVLAKAARDNGVRIEFDLGPVLRSNGGTRVQALSDLRKLRELVEYYDAPYVVSARPRSHLELRAPRELAGLGEVIGFDREQVLDGLREWDRLAARNRERMSESFIAPGVERGKYEKDD